MTKKMKLNLDDLKVQSFVTSLNKDATKLFLGGEVLSEEGQFSCCFTGCADIDCEEVETCADGCGDTGTGTGTDILVQPTGAGDGCTGDIIC